MALIEIDSVYKKSDSDSPWQTVNVITRWYNPFIDTVYPHHIPLVSPSAVPPGRGGAKLAKPGRSSSLASGCCRGLRVD